nr:hypothetical protein [Rhizobium leguminosarum]
MERAPLAMDPQPPAKEEPPLAVVLVPTAVEFPPEAVEKVPKALAPAAVALALTPSATVLTLFEMVPLPIATAPPGPVADAVRPRATEYCADETDWKPIAMAQALVALEPFPTAIDSPAVAEPPPAAYCAWAGVARPITTRARLPVRTELRLPPAPNVPGPGPLRRKPRTRWARRRSAISRRRRDRSPLSPAMRLLGTPNRIMR